MSSGEVRKVSRQDIQLVQNLIERCLQLYMTQKEVVNTLLLQAKIEPGFTELGKVNDIWSHIKGTHYSKVWQKLEEENQEFFKAYHLRLIVKDQISRFNRLLKRQFELMHQICPSGVAPLTISNGSHISPMNRNSACYPSEHTPPALKPENLHQPVGPTLPNAFGNGGSSLHPCMQTAVDVSAHACRIDVPPNMLLPQSSNGGMMQGINGGMIKSEAGYPGNSHFLFGADGSVFDTRSAVGDASVSSFSSVESNAQPLNETMLDPDASSYGFLGLIPRRFSLTDLTADVSNSSDILESYPRSPFLATDTDNFLDAQGDTKRLGTISEGLSYEDFGSD